jgi:hypothetical protein
VVVARGLDGDRQFSRDRRDRFPAQTNKIHGATSELRRVRCRHERHPPWRTGSTSGDVSGLRGQAHIQDHTQAGVEKLAEDDRYPANRKTIAVQCISELRLSVQSLQELLDLLTEAER